MTFSTLYEACHNFFGWIISLVEVGNGNTQQLFNTFSMIYNKNCPHMSSNGLLWCTMEFLGMTTIVDSIFAAHCQSGFKFMTVLYYMINVQNNSDNTNNNRNDRTNNTNNTTLCQAFNIKQ